MESIQVKGLGGRNNTLRVENNIGKFLYGFRCIMLDKMFKHHVQQMISECDMRLVG